MGSSDNARPIALDAMGSDLGPSEMVAAAALAFKEGLVPGGITLVGDEAVLSPLLEEHGLSKQAGCSIYHASEVIEMTDKPVQSLKQKKDASMVRALELVKEGKAGAVVSCGNTGSLMAGGTLKLRPTKGIERPALASVIPSFNKRFILIDVGANPEPEARHLVHNAILGVQYARVVLGIDSPRVGLLTIGTEEGKGTQLIAEAHALFKKANGPLNYKGLIEGFGVFDGVVDVVVCDGFVGNIIIKVCESLLYNLKSFMKDELMKTPIRKMGALLCKGAFEEVGGELCPERYGGAPLLGLNGLVMKAHGSSNRNAVMHTIRIGSEILERQMHSQVQAMAQQINALMEEAHA